MQSSFDVIGPRLSATTKGMCWGIKTGCLCPSMREILARIFRSTYNPAELIKKTQHTSLKAIQVRHDGNNW
jgi:hypothetical protein